ncbi:hypothetical protein A8C56_02975 [Niabella ginsenosidivorans]|uniref:Uncharacterized protein n=1 Tax=Niabella ginsenosidivorans TaxID=1176587 RepID=A0A1A9I0K2_9BACT|nr:hypothetical protein [Niabella ginsenosidivorans]ANH80084.1 hypothetical protein A8C56_02975 [Niabella ginsenosidivorans]
MINPGTREQKINALAELAKGNDQPFKRMTEQLVWIEVRNDQKIPQEVIDKRVAEEKANHPNDPVIFVEI